MLQPTEIFGNVTYLGINDTPDDSLESRPLEHVDVDYGGFVGESHSGLTRGSCVRVIRQYAPKGTEIRNARQISILSHQELAEISRRLGIDHIKPEWVGANIVFEGIPDLTLLPPSSRLIFDNGTSLVVDIENGPCKYPAEIIDSHFPGKGLDFPKQARGLRGLVGWVERQGDISLGDRARLHIPPQRLYAHAN